MSSKPKVVVAMSGGVDSSVAACLLHERGYEVVGFFMRTGVRHESTEDPGDRHRGCCSATDAADARYVAGKLGINFYSLNFQDDFERLIDHFAREYKNGRTPNPCVMCNDRLKFGKLIEYARRIDADLIATGHYAGIGQRNGRPILQRGVDRGKDQSYVLFGLAREVLRRVLLPIGQMTKEQVREHARRFDLPVFDKPDSVEICFVPDRDYARVVRQRDPEAFRPGPVVDAQGAQIGEHAGVANYTVGQRRGLRIAVGYPIYVTALDAPSNTVTVGTREGLMRRGLIAERANWLIDRPTESLRVTAKIRYQHEDAPATVHPAGGDEFELLFDTPQMAITPGQAVVLYDAADCLGGGWIRSSLE